MGMVNVRGDDDMTPDDVLAEYEPRHRAEVLAMSQDHQVGCC